MIRKRDKKRGWCFSIEGFSGSGKTSISKNIIKDIEELFGKTVRLDGNTLRSFLKTTGYSKGYTKLERGKYNYPMCELMNLFLNENINIIYTWVGLNHKGREILKKKIRNLVIVLIKTNIIGAQNIIETSIEKKVSNIIALSTDKACNPINLYGATKLAADKLFVAGNTLVGKIKKPIFSVVRYGNVINSRGSVIPYFLSTSKKGIINITDIRMTRFMITLEDAIKMVWFAFDDMKGGEIFIKKIPSIDILTIANAVDEKAKKNLIGIRAGEKLHEQMIGSEDAMNTLEFKTYYKILPRVKEQLKKYSSDFKKGKKDQSNFL